MKKKILFTMLGIVCLTVVLLMNCCTVVDSGDIGVKFHKWSSRSDMHGGVEGTCRGWVFYNPITTRIYKDPT